MVRFKESGKNRFKTYEPKDVIGFGFLDASVNYIFESFKIESQSIIKQDKELLKFLNLIFQGELAIYRDIVRRPNNMDTGSLGLNDKTVVHYNYYLYSEKHGLNKVVWSRDYKTLKELLSLYELDRKYLEQLSPDIRFRDIKELLLDYEKWKADKNIITYKV